MFDTSKQISKFHDDKVNLPSSERKNMRERRNINRDRLKKGLIANQKPTPVGCHSQGSYAMRTMVQDADSDYDIDDGVYFNKEDLIGPNGGVLTALQVRQVVCEALTSDGTNFSRQPEVLKNCVRVYYSQGYHVDVPAYRRVATSTFLNNGTTYSYELASADWKPSDPRAVTEWFSETNKRLSPDAGTNGGQFRRVVRLLKAFCRSRTSWKTSIASGFMLTAFAAEKFVPVSGRDDEALRSTMRAIFSRLNVPLDLQHPVLQGEVLAQSGDARLSFLKARLDENLSHLNVLDVPHCNEKSAMKAWDKVFSTDWFSSLLETTKSSGGTSGFGAPTGAVNKQGGGRYA